jgi:hypothetical protein
MYYRNLYMRIFYPISLQTSSDRLRDRLGKPRLHDTNLELLAGFSLSQDISGEIKYRLDYKIMKSFS